MKEQSGVTGTPVTSAGVGKVAFPSGVLSACCQPGFYTAVLRNCGGPSGPSPPLHAAHPPQGPGTPAVFSAAPRSAFARTHKRAPALSLSACPDVLQVYPFCCNDGISVCVCVIHCVNTALLHPVIAAGHHAGCFLAVMNSAAVSMGVQMSP